MKKTISTLVVPFLGVVLGLLLTSSASARRPNRVYYPGLAPVVVGYGFGYVARPYGYVYNPQLAYRQYMRYGYPPLPLPAIAPPVVYRYAYPYPYPHYGYGMQPYGYTRGPRDYLYQPANASPLPQPGASQSSPAPQLPPPAPMPQPGRETIPTPPSEPNY